MDCFILQLFIIFLINKVESSIIKNIQISNVFHSKNSVVFHDIPVFFASRQKCKCFMAVLSILLVISVGISTWKTN